MARTKKTEVDNIVETVEKTEEQAPKKPKKAADNLVCKTATN